MLWKIAQQFLKKSKNDPMTHTTEYDSAVRRNEVPTPATKWKSPEDIMHSEGSQARGQTRDDSTYMKCPEQVNPQRWEAD